MADSILVRGNDYEFTLEMDGTYADTPIRYEPGVLEEIYAKVLNNHPFQACEFSLSNYTMMRDRGADWMAAIPVFANRDFRHSIIWVKQDSTLESAEQLVGKRVGVRDYTMTAAVWLRGTSWELPLFGMTDLPADASWPTRVVDVARHAILPIVCQTYVSLAWYSRFIKANMEEVMRQDYIRTARAKGAGRWRVLLHHAFRNTLIPLVTLLGLSLPALIGGSVIIEQIFTWPGMGRLFFESIRERDYPTIMGLTLMFSVLTLLGQLVADILYCFVDPRVSVE